MKLKIHSTHNKMLTFTNLRVVFTRIRKLACRRMAGNGMAMAIMAYRIHKTSSRSHENRETDRSDWRRIFYIHRIQVTYKGTKVEVQVLLLTKNQVKGLRLA